jgi:hypothetical protein
MFLIYLDESGKPSRDKEENYVMGGIIIHESRWNEIDKAIAKLKEEFFGLNSDVYEVHMAEIIHGTKLYQAVPLKKRLDFLKKLFEVIEPLEFRVVGAIIKKEKIYPGKSIEDWGFRFLFERICWNLKDLNESLINAGQNEQKGIMVMDSIHPKYDEKIRNKFRALFVDGTYYVDNLYLIEDPLFTNSHWRNLCQLADCVTYVLNHSNKKNQLKDPEKKEILRNGGRIVYNKIVLKSNSLRYSLKIWPE